MVTAGSSQRFARDRASESSDPREAIVIASRLPFPLNDGWKVRTFHIVREVAARFHTTVLVFHPRNAQQDVADFRDAIGHAIVVETVPAPRRFSLARLLLGLVTREPVHVWNARSPAFRKALTRILKTRRRPIAIAVCSFMYQYLESLTDVSRRIIDTHNIDSRVTYRYLPHLRGVARKVYAKLTARKLEALEQRVFDHADAVWVCSAEEKRILEQRAIATSIKVVPNGVDVDALSQRSMGAPTAGQLLFFGKLDYFPNVDALRFLVHDIWPLLRDAVPHLEVNIVGRDAPPEVMELCRGDYRLHLVGAVEDVAATLARAEMVIVPLRMGGGTRLKILEALAARRPVVTTSIGAEGLDLVPDTDVIIANDAAAFAAAVLRIHSDEKLRMRLASNGHTTVRAKYDWKIVGQALEPSLLG